MTSTGLMHEAGHSKPVLRETKRDGMGSEADGGSEWGGHTCTRVWFMSMYGKTRHNIIK